MDDEIGQLRRELTALHREINAVRKVVFDGRMNTMAYMTLVSGVISVMPMASRAAMKRTVQDLSEQMMAASLAQSRSPDDTPVHAMQSAIDTALELLESLPNNCD